MNEHYATIVSMIGKCLHATWLAQTLPQLIDETSSLYMLNCHVCAATAILMLNHTGGGL